MDPRRPASSGRSKPAAWTPSWSPQANAGAEASPAPADLTTVDEQDRLLLDRYRSLAPSYDQSYGAYSEATLGRAMRFLGTSPPQRILDLACGTGLLGARILSAAPQTILTGVDVSEDMLALARARLAGSLRPELAGHVRLLAGRAERLPLADRSVDAVVIANAFHLVADPVTALGECRRVLVPHGRLVIVDWCRDYLAMRLLAWGMALTQRLARRIRGLESLISMVDKAGFRIDRAERFRARPAWGLMALAATRLESGERDGLGAHEAKRS